MKIRINDKYLFNSDTECMYISEIKLSENGKEYEKRVSGYYKHYADLFENFIQRKIRQMEDGTLGNILDSIYQAEKDVREIARKLGEELEK